jgi:hypothetical protein
MVDPCFFLELKVVSSRQQRLERVLGRPQRDALGRTLEGKA